MPAHLMLQFSSLPSLWPSYARILVAKRPLNFPEGFTLPRLEAHVPSVVVKKSDLQRYQQVCSANTGELLPIGYPHVLATPLHLAMLSNPAFPIRPLGVVHLRNKVRQQRPIRVGESLEIRAWMEGHREGDFGQEFEIETDVLVNGSVVWHESCTCLARQRKRVRRDPNDAREAREARRREAAASAWTPERSKAFEVAEDTGRRYGFASGDVNPIHLWHLTARAFGFPQAVVHGMWSLARCAAEFSSATYADPVELDVTFKQPLFLPGKVVFEAGRLGDAQAFTLKEGEGAGKPHLSGSIKPLP